MFAYTAIISIVFERALLARECWSQGMCRCRDQEDGVTEAWVWRIQAGQADSISGQQFNVSSRKNELIAYSKAARVMLGSSN